MLDKNILKPITIAISILIIFALVILLSGILDENDGYNSNFSLEITEPMDNSIVNGTITINFTSSDDEGYFITVQHLIIDNEIIFNWTPTNSLPAPTFYQYDTTLLTNGQHIFTIKIYWDTNDSDGFRLVISEYSIDLNVQN